MKTAIIGGIGAGKSHICRMLAAKGIEIYNCDAEARRIMTHDAEVQAELKALVGPDVYLPADVSLSADAAFSQVLMLNKPVLRAYMQRGPQAVASVNAIVHPRVARDFIRSGKEWMECAILFESGFHRLVDRIVCVSCPLEERLRRICQRDGCDRATAQRWIDMQMDDEERQTRSHTIILNDGTAPLEPQIAQLLMKEFSYSDEKFADIQLLRYRVEGFEALSLRQKTLIYHLSQAALAGRDILYDQNGALNLALRHLLEALYTALKADSLTALSDEECRQRQAFAVYMKRFWFSHGPHHHYACTKFLPECSREWMSGAFRRYGIPCDEALLDYIFDADAGPCRCNQRDGEDLLLTSSSNFYADGITQREAEEFYARQRAALTTPPECPPQIGLNSRLERAEDGTLRENVACADGLYGAAISRIIRHLEDALPYAEHEGQQRVIRLLIEFYRTGSLVTFDEYSIAWLEDTESQVDFVNGFIETYGDPLGYKASWESIVNFRDEAATRRTRILADHAQWFEDHSPIDARFRKAVCRGISAKVIQGAIIAGDLYPSTAIGINLPNSDWVRRDHGSKSVTIGNFTEAYNRASQGSGMLGEFVIDEPTRQLIRTYGPVGDDLHTDLHECLGHGSGQLLPGVSADALKAHASTIEEARADLFALYYMASEKLVELGLLPDAEAYKSQYYTYLLNGAITQLVRIARGATIEEAHMRNRALIARWVLEHAVHGEAEIVSVDGKTFLRVNDYPGLQRLFGTLLAEVQRIRSEGDYEAARLLVETYGVSVDDALHSEVLERYARLDLRPYKGFINPQYHAVRNAAGEVTDVTVSYTEAFDEQCLRYSREYSTL